MTHPTQLANDHLHTLDDSPPNKVRSFAKSKGIQAKTDNLDARLLSDYGDIMNVTPDPELLCNSAKRIKVLLSRREQLMLDRQKDKNRIDKIEDQDIVASITNHIAWLDDEIKTIEHLLDKTGYQLKAGKS